MFILQHRLPLSIILLWVTPMVIVAGLLFLLFVFYRDWKTYFEFAEILKGFIPFLGSLLLWDSDFSRLEITRCLSTIQ
jgi:hypothetical protein